MDQIELERFVIYKLLLIYFTIDQFSKVLVSIKILKL